MSIEILKASQKCEAFLFTAYLITYMPRILLIIGLLLGVHLHGQPAEVAFKKGILKYNTKDYKGAIVDLNKALSLNPKNANAFYCRATCKHQTEDYKGAVEDYSKTIKLKPTYADAYTKRGYSKFNLLNY